MSASEQATPQPPRLLGRPYLRELGELLLVALAFLFYFVVRGNVSDRASLALANARDLIDLERSLGFFWEADLQGWIVDSALLVRLFNAVYFWLDFPLIAVLGVSLYFFKRRQYTLTRDAILLSGALALVVYHLYPVAPPRLVPEVGVIDTLQEFSSLSYQAQSTEFFVNPYAAMPSLHVGWSILLAVGVVRAFPSSRLVLALAVLHPVSQTASTVLTGNHFLIDAVGGAVVALMGFVLALALQRWGYAWLRVRLGLR